MENVISLNERDGNTTSVANNDGVNGGPPINSRLDGENAVLISADHWMLKKVRACLKPSLVGGSIVFVWCLLATFVVLYYIQRGTSSTSTCSQVAYTGDVCRIHLATLQDCLPDRISIESEIFVSSTSSELEQQAQLLMFGLQSLNPTPECREVVEPFLCLYIFGLCDSSGELYRPSSGECETLTTETCAREWRMAVSLLGSDQLPQCNVLPASSVVCRGGNDTVTHNDQDRDGSGDQNGTLPVASNSTQQRNITCADQFYLDEEVGLCLPECHEFRLYSDTGQMAAAAIILGAATVGVIAVIVHVVLTLSSANYKKVFSFPSVIIRYLTATLLLYNITILLGCADHKFFYCRSRSLLESIRNPNAFCTFTGSMSYYILVQVTIWWLCHVTAMFWGLRFPFQAHNFKVTGKMKYLHITVVLLGLILPIIPVAVALGTGGFTLNRLPPIICSAQSSDATFYAVALPVGFMLALGITLLILLFWTIYKNHRARREQRRTPEVKVVIIICYVATSALFSMVGYAVTFWSGSVEHLTEAFTSYVGCEAAGNSTVTCERTELNDIVPIQAMFDTGHVLFAIIPVVTLLFATNVSNMKALKRRFVRYCSG